MSLIVIHVNGDEIQNLIKEYIREQGFSPVDDQKIIWDTRTYPWIAQVACEGMEEHRKNHEKEAPLNDSVEIEL
jgi:hypothetical protein